MMHWAREHYETFGRAWALAKQIRTPPPTPPSPPKSGRPPLTAREYLRLEDLGGQLEDLRVFVGKCEADQRLNDRLDLAERLRRDG